MLDEINMESMAFPLLLYIGSFFSLDGQCNVVPNEIFYL